MQLSFINWDQISAIIKSRTPQGRTAYYDPFTYVGEWLPLAAGATTPVNVNISADSDFVWVNGVIAKASSATFGTAVTTGINFIVQEASSGRQIMSAAVIDTNLFGTAQNPSILWMPRIFAANATVVLTATNLDGVNAVYTKVALVGFKVFYIPISQSF